MSATVDMRVLELLASRICHDLISPIGATGNGLELMEDDADGEALKLSQMSCRRALALLEFFRLAYGAAGNDAAIRWDAVKTLGDGLIEGSKTTLNWSPAPAGVVLPAGMVKLALNLVMMATETLPRGGEIGIALMPSPGWLAAVATARGRDVRLTGEISAVLATGADPTSQLTARSVHCFFTARLAEAFGGRLEATTLPTPAVRFAVALPVG